MVRTRAQRKSGYKYPRSMISKKALVEYDLFLTPYWSDWDDWRDGFRDWHRDYKSIKKIHPGQISWLREDVVDKRLKANAKQKKLVKRRKAIRRCQHRTGSFI